MTTGVREQKDATLRVHAEAYEKLRSVAQQEHKPLTQYLDEVAEREYRRAFFVRLNEAVARLKADPAAWAAYQAESKELDGMTGDGLELDEDWHGFDAETW